MYENNYRQTFDRLENVSNLYVEMESKKRFMEDKYQKLRRDNLEIGDRNVQLQIEVERLK